MFSRANLPFLYLLEERALGGRHILVLVHLLLGAPHGQPVHLPQRLLLGVGGPSPVQVSGRHPSGGVLGVIAVGDLAGETIWKQQSEGCWDSRI